jgi:hypothetical protein
MMPVVLRSTEAPELEKKIRFRYTPLVSDSAKIAQLVEQCTRNA